MSLFPLFFATWFSNPPGHQAASDYNAYNVQSKPFGLFQRPFFKGFDPFFNTDPFQHMDSFHKSSFDFMDAWVPDTSISQVKITTNDGVYKLVASVDKFKPEDVSVKVKGRNLVIRASNDDDGVVSSVQSYSLPYDVNVSEIQSKIEKGILTVTAPFKKKLEKNVPITVSGSSKDKNKDSKDGKQKEPERNKEKDTDSNNKNKEEKKKPEK